VPSDTFDFVLAAQFIGAAGIVALAVLAVNLWITRDHD
jgi:hypothetical protein